jgi:ubiquinone/menaquinone biosynthesis C-methylase UbiE
VSSGTTITLWGENVGKFYSTWNPGNSYKKQTKELLQKYSKNQAKMKIPNFLNSYKKQTKELLQKYSKNQAKMKIPNFLNSYNKQTKELLQKYSKNQAMSYAVGGDFDAVGLLEYFLLIQNGLQRQHNVVDVGCGSGRLAFQLREFLTGQYIGTDVVPDLYKWAQNICERPDWKFLLTPGLIIPVADDYSDFICFFSVFTHLLHEESYKYLEEAKRAIKPGGRIIFSFLEFSIPSHWFIFQSVLTDNRPDKVLNQFISRDAIQAWAEHLNLQIIEIIDGDKPNINLDRVVRWDDGREMIGKGNLGQSICVLTK